MNLPVLAQHNFSQGAFAAPSAHEMSCSGPKGPIVIDEYFDFYDPYTKRAEADRARAQRAPQSSSAAARCWH